MLVPTTMALRLASKINRNIFNSLSRRSQSSHSRHNEDIEEAFRNLESPNFTLHPHHISRVQSYHLTRPTSEQDQHRFSMYNPDDINLRKLPGSSSIGALKSRNLSPMRIMDQFPLSHLSPIQSCARLSTPYAGSRHYSSGKKCKKPEVEGSCKKIKLERCEPAKDYICTKKVYLYKDCKKKEAPYPSFSEACAEDPYNKPSECRMCPWKLEEHPNFKPTKKRFHTTVQDMSAEAKTKYEQRNKKSSQKLVKKTVYDSLNEIILAPPVSKKVVEKIQKNVPRSLPSDINQWIEHLHINSNPRTPTLELKGGKKKNIDKDEKGSCIKFPFKPETYQIGTKKPKKKEDDKCAKKKRKLIIDCPEEKDEKKCISQQIAGMLMSGKCGKSKGGKKKKDDCPKVDRSQEDVKKTPCKKPPKKPLVCPDKPLIRKTGYGKKPKKPKKKTSGVAIPEEMYGAQFNPAFLKKPDSRPRTL